MSRQKPDQESSTNERHIKMYPHFTPEERYEIYEKLTEKVPKSVIASSLGKHPSSIYREINRNKGIKGYRPKQANDKAAMRQAAKPRKVYFTAQIRSQVEAWIRQDFSPEQVVGRAEHEGIQMVSHERIYQHIWDDKRSGGTLYEHLRLFRRSTVNATVPSKSGGKY